MKIIIAGSRNILDYEVVIKAVKESNMEITEIVSGTAKGVDSLGEKYASDNNIPCSRFKAKWNDINVSGAVIKNNQYGAYNVKAGANRNEEMGEYADALIAIWDGKSSGTRHMINFMKFLNKKVFVFKV